MKRLISLLAIPTIAWAADSTVYLPNAGGTYTLQSGSNGSITLSPSGTGTITLTGTATGAEMTLSGTNTELAKVGKRHPGMISSGTTSIGAATGQFVDVTGTTTITSLGTATAGITRKVRFTGALTLTHNATSLI
ncbi:MAG: hypothetical protein WC069_06145, partial [Candidatus Shapirobacteria bacterium]